MSGQPPISPAEGSYHRSSGETSTPSSATPFRQDSLGADGFRYKHKRARVKFSVGGEEYDEAETLRPEAVSNVPNVVQLRKPIPRQRALPLPDTDDSADVTDVSLKEPEWTGRTRLAAETAQQKASHLANRLSRSAPGSRRNSIEVITKPHLDDVLSPNSSPPQYPVDMVEMQDIPLVDMSRLSKLERESIRRPYSIYEDSTESDSDSPELTIKPASKVRSPDRSTAEAHRLVKRMTRGVSLHTARKEQRKASRTGTPARDRHLHDYEYVPPPEEFRSGILSSLLKLYDQQGTSPTLQRSHAHRLGSVNRKHRRKTLSEPQHSAKYLSQSDTPASGSGQSSGKVTPRKAKWYHESRPASSQSTSSLALLLHSSASTGSLGLPGSVSGRPGLPRSRSSGMISSAVDKLTHPGAVFKKPRLEDEIRITVHIAEVIARQKYLIKLCRGLMLYGAPTHRLEEYMRASARVLQVDAHFLYLPGCMIVSFDDPDVSTPSKHVSLLTILSCHFASLS